MLKNQFMFKIGLIVLCVLSSISLQASKKGQTKQKESSKVYIIEEKTGISVRNNKTLASLYNEAVEWLKTPYRRGGMSHRGMDCSGLTNTIFKNVFDIQLQRSSRDISNKDVVELKKDELYPGDLVFFATSRRRKGVNHVGIYLGNNKFVHASVSNGVVISDLDERYYVRTWVKGGRVKNTNEIFESLFAKQHNPNIEDVSIEPFLLMDIKPNHSIKKIL